MGRLVAGTRAARMPLALCLWALLAWGRPAAAADQDAYPELMQRIQRAMVEMERQQLRLVQMSDEGPPLPRLPQFTYSFPDTPRSFESDLFAVPPSDPRYYLPETGYDEREAKRGEEEELGEGGKNEEKADVNELVIPGAGRPEPLKTEDQETDFTTTTEPNETTERSTDDMAYVLKTLLPKNEEDIILVAIIAVCGAAAAAALVALTFGWYRLHSSSKAAADIEYPAYGVTGPNKEISPTGDRRLAQSAQMYHYQHQKQQIIAMESNRVNNERRGSVSEGDSEEENEEGDYTVYECPGLAATEVGELEVKNPLFLDDPTPAANGINGHLPPEETKTADNK